MPNSINEELKQHIKYRVEQEYEKYHNQHTFELNGKDFWIEQIVWKLGENIEEFIQHTVDKAVIEENVRWVRIYTQALEALQVAANGRVSFVIECTKQNIKDHEDRIKELKGEG